MLLETFLFPGVIVPAVAAAVVFGLTHVTVRARARGRHGGGGLAVAIAFFAAAVAMTGWPRFPPVEATQRLLFVVVSVGLLAWLFALWRGRQLPWIVRAVLVAAMLGLLLESQVVHRWSTIQSALWLLGLSILGLVLDAALARGLRADETGRPTWRWSGLVAAGVPMALVGGTAVALGLAESARLAQLTGAVACAMLAVEVLGRLLGRRPWNAGDHLPMAVAIFGLLLIGFFYAQLDLLPAILLVAAFVLLTLPARSSWARLLPLVPFAIALGILIAGALNKEEDPYDYYGAIDPPRPAVVTAVAAIPNDRRFVT